MSLAVISTHPIQYHAPVYRALAQQFKIPLCVVYGSNLSVVGYHDKEFQADFAWDSDLLSGYNYIFLNKVQTGAGQNSIRAHGLKKALRQLSPKAVLLSGYSPLFHQIAIMDTLQMRYPIIFRGETTDHAQERTPIKSLVRDSALRLLYRRCALLLYVGEYSRQHFIRLGCPEKKLIFSPYCVNSDCFQSGEQFHNGLRLATRRQLGIEENQIVLLFSGKLSPRKAPDLLIAAVKSLPPQIREKIAVLFVGSGELIETLKKLSQTEPKVTAIFAGFQNQTQLSTFYHCADLLILPSRRHETWGLVVNEALLHGLPAIVSNAVGCAPDLVEPGITGEVFENGSIPALAAALQRGMPLINIADTRTRCREKVQRFSVYNAAEGIARAYTALCANTAT